MGIARKLTRLMKENDTNANELAINAGIPPTTVYSLIKRNSKRVDIDSLIKIARALGTTADYLCSDDIAEDMDKLSPSSSVSEEEKLLLKKYRVLNEEGKERAADYLDDLVSSGKYIKNSVAKMAEEA